MFKSRAVGIQGFLQAALAQAGIPQDAQRLRRSLLLDERLEVLLDFGQQRVGGDQRIVLGQAVLQPGLGLQGAGSSRRVG
jgi:hypothetical protein